MDYLKKHNDSSEIVNSRRTVIVADLGTGGQRNLLPLGVGYILSYASAQQDLQSHFDFQLHFLDRDPAVALKWHRPAVLAIACHVWNAQASLTFAEGIRKILPDILIVIGGYSVPSYPLWIKSFLRKHPAIDVLVHGEGEVTFANILRAIATGQPLTEIKGATARDISSIDGFRMTMARDVIGDLNTIPSPYQNGLFDQVLEHYRPRLTGALLETSRGCPFHCTFCDWGKTGTKVRQFDIDRVLAEIDWISNNKIIHITGADANFGMFFERDMRIAEHVAHHANATGYPKYFSMAWTKNGCDRVCKIANMLRTGGIEPAITSSVQSFHGPTLNAIKRQNISMDAYESLRRAFMEGGISTYNELILGLPLETYESFISGLLSLCTTHLTDHLGVYLCLMIENSEMNDPAYRQQFQIQTRLSSQRWRFQPIDQDTEFETDEVVVATSTLTQEEWKNAYVYANMVLSLYFLRTAFFCVALLRELYSIEPRVFFDFLLANVHDGKYPCLSGAVRFVERQADQVLNHGSQMQVVEGYGNIAFHPHEAVTTILLDDVDSFYNELSYLIQNLNQAYGTHINMDLLADIIRFQKAAMMVYGMSQKETVEFSYNVPAMVDALVTQSPLPALEFGCFQYQFETHSHLPENRIEFVTMRSRTVYRSELRYVAPGRWHGK